MSNYPPGYNGIDGPCITVVMRCDNGHHWETVGCPELGTLSIDIEECPTCGEFGEVTDLSEIPDEEDEDEDPDEERD